MRSCALLVAIALSSQAMADDRPTALVLDRPSVLSITVEEDPFRTKVIELPPGLFLPTDAVGVIDAELKRLQTEIHNLKWQAANLQTAVDETGFGFKALAISAGVGVVVGAILATVAVGALHAQQAQAQ